MSFTRRRSYKASKNYQCYFFCETINLGERYIYQAGADGRDFFHSRSHPECDSYANENWKSEDWECFMTGDELNRPKIIGE